MYTVYKITNKLNGKFYIGVHKTDNPNDSYFGSGVAIKKAIAKHGKDNFEKVILYMTEKKEEAYSLEKQLTENYATRENYNMKLGGIGGFNRKDSWKGFIAKCKTAGKAAVEKGYGFGGSNQKNHIECGRKGGQNNKGKPKSEAHKEALRETWRRKKLLTSSNG